MVYPQPSISLSGNAPKSDGRAAVSGCIGIETDLSHKGDLMDFRDATVAELLALHSQLLEELRERGVLRSANNPTGDLAEFLFCKAFGWDQAGNSAKSYDATDVKNTRFQIKGRRLHLRNKSRQMSAIRDLDGFDVLAAVLFDESYKVKRAALIPVRVVRERSTYIAHTNSHKFLLREAVWDIPEVTDVTAALRQLEAER